MSHAPSAVQQRMAGEYPPRDGMLVSNWVAVGKIRGPGVPVAAKHMELKRVEEVDQEVPHGSPGILRQIGACEMFMTEHNSMLGVSQTS